MAYRVAINGFGRIGRLTLRALLEKDLNDVEVVESYDVRSDSESLQFSVFSVTQKRRRDAIFNDIGVHFGAHF